VGAAGCLDVFEQLRVPGMKMRVRLGPKFCSRGLARYAVTLELQYLSTNNLTNVLHRIYSSFFIVKNAGKYKN
jgi:hypothetical protein